MNQNDLESISDFGDKVDIIAVQPTNKEEMDRTKNDIEKLLRKLRDVKEGEEDFVVSTPESSLDTVNQIIGGVQIFIAMVASISIFIGSLGIVNTMTTSVLERKKDIGIMKSVGAKNSHIFMQFFIESSLLGLVGGFIGAVVGEIIGIVGTISINSFVNANVPLSFDIGLLAVTLLGSFLIGGVAGIVPAMHAAKQSPVEALRE
ncbi:FtsX-like permease family protein [Candidatus Pacearchaeota archaeon]|nr:FtsX-like permease family protein [Candidatus Pacearchaeota archaeon]